MSLKKISFSIASLITIFSLTACHPRVEPVSALDKELSCADLQKEIHKTEGIKAKISNNRGVSGRNAIGLLFWPSIVINEVSGESAEKETNNRLVQLKNLYANKKCSKQQHNTKTNKT